MRRFLLFTFLYVLTAQVQAQVSLTNGSPSATIDFSNTTPSTVGTNPATAFTAAGFEPNPTTAGRLNSNAWATTGFSEGDLAFGGTFTAVNDHARGTTAVAVTTGGIYSYTGAPGSAANPTFMFQASTADFTPGTLTLRIQNNGTGLISQLAVSYNIYVRNDQGWSTSLNFSYSTDNVTYTPIGSLDYSSIEIADALGWVLVGTGPSRSTTITGLSVMPGSFIYIRWSSDDVSGSGSRDEIGLDDISLNATYIPASTDFYRSIATGDWNATSTWESSPDDITYSPAIAPPTSLSNIIKIRNGHTVSVTAPVTVDQVIIENGGVLVQTTGVLTINDGIGDDIEVQNGGIFTLSFLNNPPVFSPATGTADINTGGILRVTVGGLTGAGVGVNASNYIYRDASVLELSTAFSTAGVIYFPNVTTEIPIFRATGVLSVGAGSTTTFNGVFEANGNTTFTGAGDKIFRNGIRGTSNIDGITSGTFFITGTTAELGGNGSLTLPVSGMQIGSAGGTTVTVISNKVVTGDISLLSTNTFVQLGINNLTVTGVITGGGTNAYIRTNSTGVLTLNTILTNKTFPIGNTSYNPLIIASASGENFSARVENGINPAIAFPSHGVNRTWNIFASNPTAATVTFQYAAADVNVNALPQPRDMEILMNTGVAWSIIPGNHIVPSVGTNPYTVTSATALSINNTTVPYALGKSGGHVLAVDYFITLRAQKVNGAGIISWNISDIDNARNFEVQRSFNGSGFQTLATINPVSNQLSYNYTDASLQAGTMLYRIKVNRMSGGERYSNTVAIINDSKGLLITSMTPNPVHANTAITLSAAKKGVASFEVFNIGGQRVKQWISAIADGTNIINVNMAELPAGVYHVLAHAADARTVFRFVKQ